MDAYFRIEEDVECNKSVAYIFRNYIAALLCLPRWKRLLCCRMDNAILFIETNLCTGPRGHYIRNVCYVCGNKQ